MANKCCDGTGWTGVEGEVCGTHYNAFGSEFWEQFHEDFIE